MADVNTEQQRPRHVHVVSSLRVDVVDGVDRGRSVDGTDTISVGAARDNTLALGDPTVSRYHLEISVRDTGISVVDLGSTNGTYIGTIRIERAVVQPGTPIKLGNTTIQFADAVRQLSPAPSDAIERAGIVARSPKMVGLLADLERVATSMTSVLIVGESGTGKEVVAEALHTLSPRASEPFVTIDCGALSSPLLASELFGHERGAFTGADRRQQGAFESAGRGTIFLDEIGELAVADQAALLGVIERRRFRRVGGSTELEVGARIVAATNRDLRADVNTGRFRHDLYHRLAVVVLRLPPLRERMEELPFLIEKFARELGMPGPIETLIPSETLARWREHRWPGNVRELRNAVEATLVAGAEPAALAAAPAPAKPALATYKDARARMSREFEIEYLTALLATADGNVSRAARIADMDRSHLIDLLYRHGIKKP